MKKLFFACLMAVVLCACARPEPVPPPDSGSLWQKMLAIQGEKGPYRIQFSLRFGEEGNTRRVTGILWGNDSTLMRMDIMAGVGAMLAKMEDDPEHFILYAPRENKCYYQNGPQKPLLKVGMPIPFTLPQLAALLRGEYSEVFGERAENEQAEGGLYKLETPPGGTLKISPDGLPETWKQGGAGWTMSLIYGDGKLPEQLNLFGAGGKKAIISVKERERPAQSFDNARMRLEVPPGTPSAPLESYRGTGKG